MEALDRAMQFSDTVIRRKISQLIQKYLRKTKKMLSCAITLGLVKNTINPKISAIAFLGLMQSTVTVWSYKILTLYLKKSMQISGISTSVELVFNLKFINSQQFSFFEKSQ